MDTLKFSNKTNVSPLRCGNKSGKSKVSTKSHSDANVNKIGKIMMSCFMQSLKGAEQIATVRHGQVCRGNKIAKGFPVLSLKISSETQGIDRRSFEGLNH